MPGASRTTFRTNDHVIVSTKYDDDVICYLDQTFTFRKISEDEALQFNIVYENNTLKLRREGRYLAVRNESRNDPIQMLELRNEPYSFLLEGQSKYSSLIRLLQRENEPVVFTTDDGVLIFKISLVASSSGTVESLDRVESSIRYIANEEPENNGVIMWITIILVIILILLVIIFRF